MFRQHATLLSNGARLEQFRYDILDIRLRYGIYIYIYIYLYIYKQQKKLYIYIYIYKQKKNIYIYIYMYICNLGYAIYDTQSTLCNQCCSIHALRSHLRVAIHATKSIRFYSMLFFYASYDSQTHPCVAIYAMHCQSALCNLCNAIYALKSQL
jgi:hypothetical protein